MSQEALALVVLLLLVASASLYARHRGRVSGVDDRGVPIPLQGAVLAYAEQTFRSHRWGLVARLDRAYRSDGLLVLVELKTRARDIVHMSDVIELSVQRIALQDEVDEPVSVDAWVVVENSVNRARRPHKVRLMGIDEISGMSDRYRAVVRGQVGHPRPARTGSMCARCAHRSRCAARYGDRG